MKQYSINQCFVLIATCFLVSCSTNKNLSNKIQITILHDTIKSNEYVNVEIKNNSKMNYLLPNFLNDRKIDSLYLNENDSLLFFKEYLEDINKKNITLTEGYGVMNSFGPPEETEREQKEFMGWEMFEHNYGNKNILPKITLKENDFIILNSNETKIVKLRFSVLKNIGPYFKNFNVKEKEACFYQFKIIPFSQLKVLIDTKIINKIKQNEYELYPFELISNNVLYVGEDSYHVYYNKAKF